MSHHLILGTWQNLAKNGVFTQNTASLCKKNPDHNIWFQEK
jgi:hypothetical protein